MDPGAPGEAPLWGNSHFLFNYHTHSQNDKCYLLETVLLGLAAILYHVKLDY